MNATTGPLFSLQIHVIQIKKLKSLSDSSHDELNKPRAFNIIIIVISASMIWNQYGKTSINQMVAKTNLGEEEIR